MMAVCGKTKRVEALVPALQLAQREVKNLETKRVSLTKPSGEPSRLPTHEEIGQMVASSLLKFDHLFKSAPMEERKTFMQQWIERVEVREESGVKKARAVVRLLPKSGDFTAFYEKVVLSGPCRARTCSGITQEDKNTSIFEEVEIVI